MPIGFRSIQPTWTDTRHLLQALDAMAAMEQAVLGFLDPGYGLEYDYGGSNLPEVLPAGKYPCVLHLPSGTGSFRSLTTMGSTSLLAHPGGTRTQSFPFQILWIVGPRSKAIERLILDTMFWAKAVDQAYAANGTLGGAVHEVGLQGATAGPISFAGADAAYFGWIFSGQVRLQYILQGGG